MKIITQLFFILSILLSLGASKDPDHTYSMYRESCLTHLQDAIGYCERSKFGHVEVSMYAFYGNCILPKKRYAIGSNPTKEKTAMGCWIRANDSTLTQQEAEALIPSFDFAELYTKGL